MHALTSLRFFAALFVVVHHTWQMYFPGLQTSSLLGRFIGVGYISVDFFFLLSGYILAVVYLARERPVKTGPFFRARFARVYPLFLLTLLMDVPNLFLDRKGEFGWKIAAFKTAAVFAGKLAMLQAWIPQVRGLDDPNWSLSVETIFYLSFPFLGPALWKLRGARLWLVAVAIYLGGVAISIESFQHIHGDLSSHLPPVNMFTFALGILLARWQSLSTKTHLVSKRTTRNVAFAVSTLGLICLGAVVFWSALIPNLNLLVGLLVPSFLAWIWAFSQSDWLPAKLLSAPWLVVLGEASFGLYLLHIPIYKFFVRLGWNHTPAFPMFLGTSIGLSVLSFYYFETPARRWILKRAHVPVKETMEMASNAQ